jgi:hypothetical protein
MEERVAYFNKNNRKSKKKRIKFFDKFKYLQESLCHPNQATSKTFQHHNHNY